MAKLENKTKENPKLEQNKLSDGRISLYLEYYLGREEKPVLDENGNQVYYDSGKMQGKPKFAVKHNRRKENLSLYLIDKPRTPAERQQNKETWNSPCAYVQSVNRSLKKACWVTA